MKQRLEVYLEPSRASVMELFCEKYFHKKTFHCRCSNEFKINLNSFSQLHSANIYLFKVNNRKRCEICSKLTIKSAERRQRCRSRVFIVDFEHIPHLFLEFLLLTLNKLMLAGQ